MANDGTSSVVIAIVPGSAPAWWGVVAVVLVIVLADAWAGFRLNAPQVERDVAGSLSLVTWVDIRLTLQNIRGTRPLTVEVFDHYPDSFAIRGLPCSARIHARHYADLSYRARPMQRGEVRFAGCEMRIASPLGFWWRRKFDTTESVVRVYPNYSTISKLLAFEVEESPAACRRALESAQGRRYRVSSTQGLPRRRHAALDRLEGDCAHGPVDRARVSGRT